MAFLVGGANSAADTGYDIDNSLRFNNDNSTLIKSFDAAGNRRTFTVSTWVKLGDLAGGKITGTQTGGDNYFFIGNKTNGQFTIQQGDDAIRVATKALNRDPSAWYHTVFAFDTTQGTDTNRVKIYVNGVQADVCRPEAFTTAADYPSQNLELFHNMTTAFGVGCRGDGDNPLEGSLSEFYFIDGTQYAASDFGEFNDNGVWIPKDAKDDLTFGTNGFYLEFKQTGTSQNSSGIGADTSGNDNHFAVSNLAATDVTTDTPTNNFATLNPLIPVQQVPTYSEGNTKVVFKDGGNGCSPLSTFAVNSGKFYFEAKFVQTSDPGHGAIGVGIVDADKYNPYGDADDAFDLESFGYSYTTDGNAKTSGNDSSFGDEFNSGDIIGVAVDFDNRQIYYSKNGTFQDSGDPTSGASGTGSAHNFSVGTYYFAVYGYQDENSWEMNFGNAPFSISSGNTDGKYGNFEYAVPSGYYALCTKNLAEYG
jgi:hypothetical protein